MDNYFTFPKVMPMLREREIVVFGTSRFKKCWPPNNLLERDPTACNFNDFFHLTDYKGTLLARWIDNGIVYCVSIIHRLGEIIKMNINCPIKTKINSKHIDTVFADNSER